MDNEHTLNFTRSHTLAKKAEGIIAGFTQSMMKKPEQFSPGQFPIYLQSGDGAIVTDVDGNQYIDFICGLAANTLGHNHPATINAIKTNLPHGLIHSLPAPREIDAAQMLTDIIPGTEMVRFFKTGADANSAAVRLARFITSKEEILTVGYNGWHDQYMFDTPGVPSALQKLTHRASLAHPSDEADIIKHINEHGHRMAAILLSLPYNRELNRDFLQSLRDACTNNGVLFIWDEIVTGFRLSLGGAQEYFGVQADLVTLSKGIAAGMPLSAVCGKMVHMKNMEKLQVSTTFGGELLSLAVCCAALQEYQSTDYIQRITYLGKRLKDAINRISLSLGTPLQVVGYDAIPMFLFSKNPELHTQLATLFLGEMAKRNVLLRRDVNFICSAHTDEHIDHTINAALKSLQTMKENMMFTSPELENA